MFFTILLIFILNSVTDNTLPWGTPISCCFSSEKTSSILTLNRLSWRKFWINIGILPPNPRFFRSFTMPYFQVVSYAFSRSKKTATRCSFLIETSLMNVSYRIRWSIGFLWLLIPDWYSVINLLVSKYQINLAFTILSSVLHTQLLRVMGL